MNRFHTLRRPLLLVLLCLVPLFLLSGCASWISTKPMDMGGIKLSKTKIALKSVNVKVAIDDSDSNWQDFYSKKTAQMQKDFYSQLVTQAKGMIDNDYMTDLNLTVSLKSAPLYKPANQGLTFFSFFIPPLALIPEGTSADYHITWSLKDNFGTVVTEKRITGTIEGSFSGWYVGRQSAAWALRADHLQELPAIAAPAVLRSINEELARLQRW